jgi:high-affinity iron transporter
MTARTRSRPLVAAVALVAAAASLCIPAPIARAAAPWQQATAIQDGLFEAQADVLLEGGASAASDARAAAAALSGRLERQLARRSPSSLRDLRAALTDAESAAAAGDQVGLAAARGRALAALRRGAFDVAVAATTAGEVQQARGWLLIRDFRQATRFTRPGVDGTIALDALEGGEIAAEEAVTGVRKDLLDAYQARLLTALDDAATAAERGFAPALAENTAIAAGYWQILAPEYSEQRGQAARESADRIFERLAASAARSDAAGFERNSEQALAALNGFTAAPFTPEEQARRANQLIRFFDLVPIEYDDGTEDGRVTIPFEIQEAVAFLEGARSAFADLKAPLVEQDPEGVAAVEAAFDELEVYVTEANEGVEVVDTDEVDETHEGAADRLDEMFPEEWKETDTDADFDLIEISLDQMEAAAGAGEREQAEQARLTAYAFFEFGPELLLRSLDPRLVADVEGLVWYGARDRDGLAQLIASDASVRDIRETRLTLDEALQEAKDTTGDGASGFTVVTNAALIVFREGLEAILIIAAVMASMVGARRPLRTPIARGALLALPASALLFVIAVLVLDEFAQYGERLEAVVGLVAIGVLLLVLNWFFHRVYWTEWIAGHRRRSKELAGAAVAGGAFAGATIAGLYLLGFSSVFREGFETVLFLQALQLEAGTGIVLAGVSLGLAAVAVVGVLTFKLEQRLPYKRMLVVTGVLIALVLVVMVGNTVRTLQGVGWLPITPIDVDFPLWMGTWLGIFPTWETLGAQLAALGFVIGSYYLAEWVRKRQVRKAVEGLEEAATDERAPLAVARTNGNGANGAGGHPRQGIDTSRTPERLEPEPEPTRRP